MSRFFIDRPIFASVMSIIITLGGLTLIRGVVVVITGRRPAPSQVVLPFAGLRYPLGVAVDGGGCSGFQYRFELVEEAEADDLRVERDGAAAVVDLVSLDLIRGSEIDFADELAAAEFRVRNPNAKSSCGCGVSFSV